RQVQVEVEPVAFEIGVRLEADGEHQVPRGTADGSRGAAPGDAHLVAVARAGRDADGDGLPAVLHLQLELGATDGGDEVDGDLTGDVGALGGGATPAPALRRSEQVAEQIAEAPGASAAEHLFEPAAAAAEADAPASARGALVGPHGVGVEPFAQRVFSKL